ncbi:stage II sporulation protein D [Paenibacillus nanensis]|uniref:Stage II sporulation protein D n=1 Tax=Paenibacillus nanensis TaxID=393251 RepID=A0A3A1US82_9BACL|nr:stage II sporulation protein D [Paenibacillus nanensis]
MKVLLKDRTPPQSAQKASVQEDLQALWDGAVEVSIPEQAKSVQSVQAARIPAQTVYEPDVPAKEAAVETESANNEDSKNISGDDKKNESAGTIKIPAKTALDGEKVRVYLTDKKRIETVPLETYVMGVLAAEMPIDFHLEALKAQAVAARTYIVRRLSSGARSGEADVLDTVQHQVYFSKDELASRWKGKAKRDNLAKLKQAVEETRGLVMTYEGEPIEAAFFSTSNGYTENSEDYWEQPLPYLRSVASPWDKELSPRYEADQTLKLSSFYRAMGLSGKAAKGKPAIKVTEWTDGKRIKEVEINGKAFSGREVRERLGLASSHFSWKIGKDSITITTYGLGHGVGMSQWGANGMAQDGKTAEEILEHYYTGASLEQASKLPKRTNS